MKKFYFGSFLFLAVALCGCDTSEKNNPSSVPSKPAMSNVSSASDELELKVLDWGPHQSALGVSFNKQPNGESAFWFVMAGKINPDTKLELWFGNNKLKELVLNASLAGSSYIPNSLLDKVGDYPLYLIHAASKKRFDIGVFKIMPAPLAKSTSPSNTAPVVITKNLSKRKATQTQ